MSAVRRLLSALGTAADLLPWLLLIFAGAAIVTANLAGVLWH